MSKLLYAILALALNCARGHVAYWNTPNHLHPVQSLYVKPSVDGTTGDLYVAASEDSGVKTQWLTDQPVNFLPVPAAQQSLSGPYSSSFPQGHEAVVTTQKRAVITGPTVKYTYALPGASSDGKAVPYPYAIPVSNTPANPSEGALECAETPVPASYSQYSPFQYYYPQMMSAFANAINALREGGLGEDAAVSHLSALSQSANAQPAPVWPSTYAYPYPVQYVMVDPTTWAQSQSTTAAPQPASLNNSAATSEETA